jgi:hypothetical protein
MRLSLRVLGISLFLAGMAGMLSAAAKTHVITFGRWTSIRLLSGANEDQPLELKIRPLYVDGVLKAYTLGIPHEITDRLLVVRRMVRVNDALPSETSPIQQWIWQRGGWLLIDRANGHISSANLPEFDPNYSVATWYRDYVAYCGISQDGRKLYAIVMQLGRRKPILKKPMAESNNGDSGASECMEPTWQRQPTRVTFLWKPDQTVTYAIRGSAVELSDDDEEGTE